MTARGGGGALAAQMGIFDRLARVAKSYAGAVTGAMEDPGRALDRAVQELREEGRSVARTLDQVRDTLRQLEGRQQATEKQSGQWEQRARRALSRGDEGMAREALARSRDYRATSEALAAQVSEQQQVVLKLQASERLLEGKVSEAISKRDSLQARAQAAKATRRVQELVQGLDTGNAVASYERARSQVELVEAEADAAAMLASESLEAKLGSLAAAAPGGAAGAAPPRGLDAELAALKADVEKRGAGPAVMEMEMEEERADSAPAWLNPRRGIFDSADIVKSRGGEDSGRRQSGPRVREVEVLGDEEDGPRVRSGGDTWQEQDYEGPAFGQQEAAGPFGGWRAVAALAFQVALGVLTLGLGQGLLGGAVPRGPVLMPPGGAIVARRPAPFVLGPFGPVPVSPYRVPRGLYGGPMTGLGPRGPVVILRGPRRFPF